MSSSQASVFDPQIYSEESRQAWSSVACNYDQLIARHFATFTQDILEWAEIKGGEQVLDVACGAGLVTLPVSSKLKSNGRVIGVDFAPAMIALANQKAKETGVSNIEFRQMNAEALEFNDGSFNVVFCQLGLMLFANPLKALQEMRRVLVSGGRVFITVQGVPEKMLFTSIPMKAMVKHAPWLKVPGAPTLYTFGPQGALEKILRDAGFVDSQTRRVEGALAFSTPQQYWETLIAGAGRTKSMLESLEPDLRQKIRDDVCQAAATFDKDNEIKIPYEVVLSRAFKK